MINGLLVSVIALAPGSLMPRNGHERFVVGIELDDHKVRIVGEVMARAEGEVVRICLSQCPIREFACRMRKHGVPPVEESVWVASCRYWIIPRAVTCRDCLGVKSRNFS